MNGVYATYRHPYCFGCRWLGFCESMCCSRQRCCTGCWFISWCLPHSHSVSLGHVVCLGPRTGSLLFCNYCHFKDFTSQCLGKMGNEKASLWEIGLLEVNIFFLSQTNVSSQLEVCSKMVMFPGCDTLLILQLSSHVDFGGFCSMGAKKMFKLSWG